VFTSQVALLAVLDRIGNLRIPFLLMQSGPTAWSTRPPPPTGPSKPPPELVSFYSWPGQLILASPFLADRLVSRLLAGCLPEHLRSIESGNDQTRRGPEAARSHLQSGLAFESHQTI
jgi:hypothetical protein